MKIKMTLELPVEIFEEETWYVANCPALDVASQGDTPEEAKTHLVEALMGFLETCIAHGTLDEVLRDCGFSSVAADKLEDTESPRDTVEVPLYLLAKFTGSSQCHHA